MARWCNVHRRHPFFRNKGGFQALLVRCSRLDVFVGDGVRFAGLREMQCSWKRALSTLWCLYAFVVSGRQVCLLPSYGTFWQLSETHRLLLS